MGQEPPEPQAAKRQKRQEPEQEEEGDADSDSDDDVPLYKAKEKLMQQQPQQPAVTDEQLLAALHRMITPESVETLSMKGVMKQLRGEFGEGVKERRAWLGEQVTSIVQALPSAADDDEARFHPILIRF